MVLTKACEWCERQFDQETRRGRPYKRCEHCRKFLWYERQKAIDLLYKPQEEGQ